MASRKNLTCSFLPDSSVGLDYSVAEQHIALLTRLAQVANVGISVYDAHAGKHIFTSYNSTDLFGYDMQRIEQEYADYFNAHIHPDDLPMLRRSGEGLYSKEISERLAMRVHTVNMHRQRILEKLNVDNSMEAVKYAARNGLLT